MTLCNGKCGLAVAVSFVMLTGTALAVVATQDAFEVLLGVDGTGSPSEDNAGIGTGKLYKDTNTGVLYELVSGVVINQSSKKKTTFNNLGVSITDPGQNQTFTATNDQEVIYRSPDATGFALAGRVAVFFPPAN